MGLNTQLSSCNSTVHEVRAANPYRKLANYYLSTSSIDTISENVLVVNRQSFITPVKASQLFQKGYDAIVNKDYTKAIQIFEEYQKSASPSKSEYLQASKWLLKAYQASQQLDNAISLCQQLHFISSTKNI